MSTELKEKNNLSVKDNDNDKLELIISPREYPSKVFMEDKSKIIEIFEDLKQKTGIKHLSLNTSEWDYYNAQLCNTSEVNDCLLEIANQLNLNKNLLSIKLIVINYTDKPVHQENGIIKLARVVAKHPSITEFVFSCSNITPQTMTPTINGANNLLKDEEIEELTNVLKNKNLTTFHLSYIKNSINELAQTNLVEALQHNQTLTDFKYLACNSEQEICEELTSKLLEAFEKNPYSNITNIALSLRSEISNQTKYIIQRNKKFAEQRSYFKKWVAFLMGLVPQKSMISLLPLDLVPTIFDFFLRTTNILEKDDTIMIETKEKVLGRFFETLPSLRDRALIRAQERKNLGLIQDSLEDIDSEDISYNQIKDTLLKEISNLKDRMNTQDILLVIEMNKLWQSLTNITQDHQHIPAYVVSLLLEVLSKAGENFKRIHQPAVQQELKQLINKFSTSNPLLCAQNHQLNYHSNEEAMKLWDDSFIKQLAALMENALFHKKHENSEFVGGIKKILSTNTEELSNFEKVERVKQFVNSCTIEQSPVSFFTRAEVDKVLHQLKSAILDNNSNAIVTINQNSTKKAEENSFFNWSF